MAGDTALEALTGRVRDALARGRLEEAERLMEGLPAAARPGADLALQLALAQREAGRLDPALATLVRAVAAHGQDARLWGALGGLRRETGDTDGARAALERALAIDPGLESALYNLATLSLASGDAGAAVPLLERLTARSPGDVQAWSLLGLACSEAHRVDGAVAALRRARALAPRSPEVANDLGVMLGYAGDLAGAREAFQAAVELDPDYGWAWENLVRSRRLQPRDRPLVESMEQAHARARGDVTRRTCLCFALGKALDDLGEPGAAFAWYRAGNELVNRQSPFDSRRYDAFVASIVATVDRSLLERCRAVARPGPRPVFVVGMPRSGTTLVEQVLAADPSIHGAGELQVVPRAVAALEAATGARHPAAVRRAGKEELADFARRIATGLEAAGPAGLRVVDKLPGNYLHVGLLHALLPDAAIVHCRRDPRDTCLSIYFQRFSQGQHFAYSLANIGACYRGYLRLMERWRGLLGGRLVEVDYEALVADPDGQARRLYRALGLDWTPEHLQRVGNPTAVRTASSWQVREPIRTGSVQRWRRYAPFIGELETALGDAVDPHD